MSQSPIVSASLIACIFMAAGSLSGCGLAETTAVAASEASTAAEQAKQGKALEDKVQRDIEAAQKAEAAARDKADADNQ